MSNLEVIVATLFLLIVFYLIYDSYLKKKREESTKYVTREVLICLNCNYKVEKDFEPGDFIGLVKGKCPRCGGGMKIKGIFSVEASV